MIWWIDHILGYMLMLGFACLVTAGVLTLAYYMLSSSWPWRD